MPYETRRISLSDDELFQAVALFQRLHPLELPLVHLVSVRVHENHIEATLRPSSDSTARSIVALTPALSARVLVAFCLEGKIPLPRQADKTFCVENGRATLLIKVATGKAAKMEHFAAQHRRGQADHPTETSFPDKALADLMMEIETRTDELKG